MITPMMKPALEVPSPILPHGDLLRLKSWNTPTIYNGWEQITKHDSDADAFNLEEILAAMDAAAGEFGEDVQAKFGRKEEWG